MLDTPKSDFQLPDISAEIHKKHTWESLRQAKRIAAHLDISKYLGRLHTTGVTIDSLSSPDLDDGIHVEKLDGKKWWKLLVSIASPTEIVEPNSPMEQEAIDRATSVYFWEKHILHMFPNRISTDISSLNHKKHRLTLTLELHVNEDFEITSRDLYQSVFFNRQRHSPQSFTRGITDTASGEYEYFSQMHELARWLRKRRESEFRIDSFDDADRRITMWEKIHGHTNSHISSFVIQEFMLVANTQIAEMMDENAVHWVYRMHMPEYEHIRDLPKRLDRAEYAPEPWFHRWLWIAKYSHFTSPIRRIADYISHRQLVCLLEGREEFYTAEQIQELCRYINLQITATLSNQRIEMQDMRGKQIVRKGKRNPDGLYSSMKQHIKFRKNQWLRIPKSIRDEIIRQIQDKQHVEDWIIKEFILSSETDIIEEMRDMILSDCSTRKYINILWIIDGITITENPIIQDGVKYYRVLVDIDGNELEFRTPIEHNFSDGDTSPIPKKQRKEVTIEGTNYTLDVNNHRKAVIATLKKAIAWVFDFVLS